MYKVESGTKIKNVCVLWKFVVDKKTLRWYISHIKKLPHLWERKIKGEIIMKKLIAILLVLLMAVPFVACDKEEKYTVGICQFIQHDALDAATAGFKAALTDKLGDKVEFVEENASGDTANCTTIVNSLVSQEVDLIMANATPALQAAANATRTIPILGTSVTEYGVALDIENFSGTVGGNISGTSDLAPLDQQAEMILEWFPEAKKVGLLYCSAEANSKYQVDSVAAYLHSKGIETEEFAFMDSNDMAQVAQKANDNSDVIYIPTDNAAANGVETINSICKTPIIAGEGNICKGCGVATLSIDYYDLGYKTGEMAAQILTGEADISTMPIGYADPTKFYNAAKCEELGIAPLEGYEKLA